jgi:hypothetical protein
MTCVSRWTRARQSCFSRNDRPTLRSSTSFSPGALRLALQPLKLVSTVRDLLGTSALAPAQRHARDVR